MNSFLDKPKIEYVLNHLQMRIEIDSTLRESFVFIKDRDFKTVPQGKIVFLLCDTHREESLKIGKVPLFYPIKMEITQHYTKENGSFIFTHDIMKQIFCLQTLYYEREISRRDKLGRVVHEDGVNYRLNITDIPVVDYLFEVIIEVIEQFSKKSFLVFKRKSAFDKFGFILSHDVDRVESYNLYNTLNSVKQLTVFNGDYPAKIKRVNRHIGEFLKLSKRSNPLWDFEDMQALEHRFNLTSTFFFLGKGELHKDAYYNFADKNIKELIKQIEANKSEIGLHVTIKGNNSSDILSSNLAKLQQESTATVKGARSHWLRFDITKSGEILEALKIKYDSSISFYSKEGFRASTCLPYKLYSLEQNRELDVWEVPLIFMECSLLDYQNVTEQEALEKVSHLLNEVVKFKGVFTLLWHNGNFHKKMPFPRKEFYIKLLEMITNKSSTNITGAEVIARWEKNNVRY